MLATDLEARSDRAMARAVQLARQWQARLVIVCVLPSSAGLALQEELMGTPGWSRSSDLRDWAERQLARLLGPHSAGIDWELHLEEGEVGPALLRVATATGCGLIVAGQASNGLFQTPRAGSTVVWLSRHSLLPLLLVRHPAGTAYRSLVLATDFSPASAQALAQALALFGPPIQLDVVHALELPQSGLRDIPHADLESRAAGKAAGQARQFLARGPWEPDVAQQARMVIAPGEPARVVARFARDHDRDLVVVARHGRPALETLLLGSNARRLMAEATTDLLLVRMQRTSEKAE